MTQDFTEIGTSPTAKESPKLALIIKKLTGEFPMGADAPTHALRTEINLIWTPYPVIKYGFFGLLFLLAGGLFLYLHVTGSSYKLLPYGIGFLGFGLLLLKWCAHDVKRLRKIARIMEDA